MKQLIGNEETLAILRHSKSDNCNKCLQKRTWCGIAGVKESSDLCH